MSLDKLVRFSWTDDTGSGLDGTIINNTQLQKIFDAVDGSIGQSVKVMGSEYTAIPTDDFLKVTGGTFQITAYTAVGYDGRQLDIANVGTGTITVRGPVGQTVGSYANWPLPPKTSIRIKSDGANWVIMSLSANSTTRQELTLVSGAFRPWPGAPCGPHEDINSSGYYTLGIPFSDAAVQYAYSQFTLPKALVKSANITVQFYFVHKAGAAGWGVQFGAGIAGMGHGEGLGQAAAQGVSVVGTSTAPHTLSISGEFPLAGNWMNNNDLTRLYIYRDPNSANDGKTNVGPAYVLAVKLRAWMEAPHDE